MIGFKLKKAKHDWDKEAKYQNAQPDYYWVQLYEDEVDDLKKQIKDMKELQGNIITLSSS